MERIGHPRFSTVMIHHFHRVWTFAQLPHLVQVVVNEFVDRLRLLIRHNSNRELARHFTRDDRFCSRFAEGSLDAVERKGRETPAVHERLGLFCYKIIQ